MEMKISIVIATWNAEQTLTACLNSIVPQLTNETELIIIDGGSKDKTNEIIKSFGDKISVHISEADYGIYDAWNKGVKKAHGDWVMFIGADDILLPQAINTFINVIDKTLNISDFDYICAHNEYVNQNNEILKILGKEPKWSEMRYKMPMAHVASLHSKKNLFDSVGGFNLDFRICADYELLMRKKDKLKFLFIPNHIARMKVGGMSFSSKAIIETYKIRKLHNSIPIIVNELVLVKDYIAFKLFSLRKNIKGNIFNMIISKYKGEDFVIDRNVPISYLIRLGYLKFISLTWGTLRLRTFKKAFINPSAKIISSSKIHFEGNLNVDYGCYIDATSKEGIYLGKNVSVGIFTTIRLTGSIRKIADKIVIGNNVGLGTHGYYGCGVGSLIIGDNTIIGNYVSFHPENHNFSNINELIRMQGVTGKGIIVGNNCWIGAKATILDGSNIGNGCIVAAGAVVIGSFPDNCIIGGIPAKIIRYR